MRRSFKMLSVLLAAVMLFTCVSLPVFADTDKTLDDYPDEVYLLDANDKSSIEATGLSAVTSPVNGNSYAGKWKFSDASVLRFKISDICAYETMEFYLYGDENYPSTLVFTIWADNSETDGSDYYGSTEFEVLEGWNKYTFSISALQQKKTRSPRPLNDIDGIYIQSAGWGTANDKATVLYVGSAKLIKGDVLLTDGTISVNSGAVPVYNQVKSNAVSEVADAVCLKVDSPFALVYHEQKRIDETNEDITPVAIDGEIFAPVSFMEETFGADITLGIDTGIYNGVEMASVSDVAESLGKKFFYDDMGLVIVSDTTINLTKENDLDKMLDIMAGFTYERPSREKIKADITATTPNHPRLLATADDFARIKSYMEYDSNIKTWIAKIISTADKYVKSAPNEADHTYAADVGGRLASSYSIQAKATSMGMAYQLTGDETYAEALWYTLEDLCDRTKWEHWHPGHFLNAADVMWGVAIAYDWMYDAWTAEQKKIIEDALYDCGVEDSITAYYGATDYLSPPMGTWHRSGWWRQGNNWNAVCNSGVVAAGVALATHEQYGDLAVKAINFAVNGFEVGLRCYAPDGGYEEGPGYWSYGTNHAIMLMAALSSAAGTNYGLSDAPGFSDTYATPLYSESKKGMFNYSDTSASRTDTSSLFWFGKEYGDAKVSGLRLNEITDKEKSETYKDILWYNPENIDTDASLELDYTFFKTDTLTMRSSWTDSNQLFAGLHGGSNTANHCNIDSGTFVLDALGTRWFIDLGSDNYNLPNYWSTGTGGLRWQYYTQRAEGHNTFVINPSLAEDQVIKSVSPVTELVSKPRGAYGKVDLTDAYATDVTKATRGIMMTANRKAVIVQDEITMIEPSEFYWFAHTKADIEIAEDGRSAVLALNSDKLKVTIVSDNADFKFDVMDAVSLPTSPVPEESEQKENSREGIRKLVIHGSDISEVNLAVVMQPVVMGESEYPYTYTKLDDWSIPDGEIIDAELKDIKIDSASLEGFNPYKTDYTVILPYGTTKVPDVTAVPDELSSYTVTLPESLPGEAVIKAYYNEDLTMYSLYTVYMRAANEIEIEVSGAQEGNPGEQCLDKDLSTRWAVEGESWGIFRFAKPKTVSSVWLAAWKSAERKLIFDIEVSYDGENFTQVWSGQSTSDTDELEEFKIPRGTYKAIKLVLHGTTTVAWNSLLEVEFENDAPEGTVTINVDVSGGSGLKINGENKGTIATEQVYTGSVLEMSAAGDENFMFWIDTDSKTILSFDEAYSFTVGSGRNVSAIYSDSSSAYVTFTSMTNKLAGAGLASAITVPVNPYVYGYNFDGWYIKDGEKTNLTAGAEVGAEESCEYVAGFKKDSAKYKVTVNGKVSEYTYNKKIELKADAEKDGKAFSYWIRDTKPISYSTDYTFYVNGDTEVEAVYGKTAEAGAILVMADPVLTEEGKLAFFAEVDIPTEYTVIESGILIGTSEGVNLENAEHKAIAESASNKAQYTVRKAGLKAGTAYCAVVYAICHDKDGNLKIMYSNEVSYTAQ